MDERSQHNPGTTSFATKAAPSLPSRSNLQLGQADPLSGFKLIRGQGALEETLACFQMLAAQMKLPFRRDSIDKVLRDSLRRGQEPNIQLCGQLGASLGLHVMSAKVPGGMGTRLQTPCMLQWDGGFAFRCSQQCQRPDAGEPAPRRGSTVPGTTRASVPRGNRTAADGTGGEHSRTTFRPQWFLPALTRYRGVLAQVLVASFVVQLFGLANPLLIQVIIDKVISQRSLDTLQVLGIGLVVVTLLEGVPGSLRTFLFAETTNRIDQRLGAEVIDHLLRLPLGY